jgi:hypothetical protein
LSILGAESALSGHKTMTVFKRYNTVSEEELKALVGEKIWRIDTYMDTKGFLGKLTGRITYGNDLEAAPGFEPGNNGFADRCLTTWLCRLLQRIKMERETGFEPATSTLARLHSTTELFPLARFFITVPTFAVKEKSPQAER